LTHTDSYQFKEEFLSFITTPGEHGFDVLEQFRHLGPKSGAVYDFEGCDDEKGSDEEEDGDDEDIV
jgi:hypothetical protein